MKAVILAAGKGTRMRGLCNHTPKPMLPIANRSIISLIFARLKSVGIRDVALVIGFEGDKLKALIGDGSRYGVNVTYVRQEEQLGTGHAALICEQFVAGDPFFLIFGDILTPEENFAGMVELFGRDDCDAVLSVFPVEDPSNGAAVDVQDGLVAGIIEKPPPGTIQNAYNNAGVFIWPAEIFDLIRDLEKSPRGEYEFTDGIIRFIAMGRRLGAFELRG
ncbi:MAG: nucleotidyltransferase family protein, partial [Planctomycetota bacterium]